MTDDLNVVDVVLSEQEVTMAARQRLGGGANDAADRSGPAVGGSNSAGVSESRSEVCGHGVSADKQRQSAAEPWADNQTWCLWWEA